VHHPIQVVHHDACGDAVLRRAVLRVLELLSERGVRAVLLAGMRLADIDGEELEAALAVDGVEVVERGDLPDEGRSGDRAELQHDVAPA
jgi:hypothetical protein